MEKIYVGLGGNIGNTTLFLNKAVEQIKALPGIYNLKVSRLYRTTPVGGVIQNDFINAACSFDTEMDAETLLSHMQEIEKNLGKQPIEKNGPRTIDLDLLFYGTLQIDKETCQVPHPRWNERLFVMTPLLDLTEQIGDYNLKTILTSFKNVHNEILQLID